MKSRPVDGFVGYGKKFNQKNYDDDSQNSSENNRKQSESKHNKIKQNQYSYSQSEQQSQTQSSQSQNQYNYQKKNVSDSLNNSQSQQQSDQEDQGKQNNKKRLLSLKQESNQQEQSIDYIQERIKKLQRDLQERLDKHKTKNNNKKETRNPQNSLKQNQQSGRIISMKNRPPSSNRKQAKRQYQQKLPQTQINFKPKIKSQNRQLISNEQNHKKYQEKKSQPTQSNVQSKIKKPKQNVCELINVQKKQINSPIKVNKKSSKKADKNIKTVNHSTKSYIPDDLKRLNKEINTLKKQNKQLKQELSHYKRKKKPADQILKLKQLSQHDTKKLQKQFELLKVLEKLQTKLKNSIQRKLGKGTTQNKQNKHAALLHKGLSSNILN